MSETSVLSGPRCDLCKFWDRSETKDMAGAALCTKAIQLWDATEWGDEEHDFERLLKPEFSEQKMFVQDGSDYSASLWTRPEFYCAHYEAMGHSVTEPA